MNQITPQTSRELKPTTIDVYQYLGDPIQIREVGGKQLDNNHIQIDENTYLYNKYNDPHQ